MSEWEFKKLDEQYGRVEDLRNERRAENARIIASHATIKPEFVAPQVASHDGRTIADLYTLVTNEEERLRLANELRAALQELHPDLCGNCMGYGEVAVDHPGYGYEVVTCPTCGGKS